MRVGERRLVRGSRGTQRLLFVVNSARFFVSHRLPLAQDASDAGYEVHVATGEAGEQVELILESGLTYHPLSMTRTGVRPWREARNFIELARLYRKLRPDLVHHVALKPILYGGIVARYTGVPAVVHAVTGLGSILTARTARAYLLRAVILAGYRFSLAHQCQRVIFQNPEDREFFLDRGLVTEKGTVVIRGSGVDLQEFSPSASSGEECLIVLASRMLESKGVLVFAEAASKLRREGSSCRFVLVGPEDPASPDSIPKGRLEQLSDVEWWGYREDMPRIFAEANVVCLPTMYGEGVPKVLIEAAACAKPLVATDVAGCREIVRDGRNGFLVPVGNPDVLAQALRKLLGDERLRRTMGARSRKLVEEGFSLESVNSRTLEVYANLLDAGS